jgi:uncharacterized protein (TIGR02271 family)
MARQTITALYDRYEDASAAVTKLHGIGIADDDISIVANNEGDRYSSHASGSSTRGATDDSHADDGAGTGATAGTLIGGGAGLLAGLGLLAIPGAGPVVAAGWLIATLTGAGIGAATGGLVGALVGAGVPEEHAHSYAEGVRRGGTLVTVRTDDAHQDRVVSILDENGSVDMEERERDWRSQGWKGLNEESGFASSGRTTTSTTESTGYGAGTAGMRTSGMGAATASDSLASMPPRTSSGMSSDSSTPRMAGSAPVGTSGGTDFDATARRSQDTLRSPDSAMGRSGETDHRSGATTIPIVEEKLDVSKREVGHGRVRVHSHVVETPVKETVSLREEHVDVQRRPVDRAVGTGDDAFRDRTIEMEERGEEPVITKNAHVTEEVTLGKTSETENRTVSDTVRRTEVEIEDERKNRIQSGDRTRT